MKLDIQDLFVFPKFVGYNGIMDGGVKDGCIEERRNLYDR